jgi:hypothetical protein
LEHTVEKWENISLFEHVATMGTDVINVKQQQKLNSLLAHKNKKFWEELIRLLSLHKSFI